MRNISKNRYSNVVLVLLCVGMAWVMVACATSQADGNSGGASYADCRFPGTREAAPAWVCDEPVPGVDVSAVGSHPKTGAGFQFAKTQAATQARAALARQMQSKVSNLIKNWAETTGVGESETVDTVASATTKSVTSESIVGSKIYKSTTDPNGTTYVLVGLDDGASITVQQKALRNSYQNNQAAWQRLQSDKSFDELEKELLQLSR